MDSVAAIVLYECEIAGRLTGSIDVQVRYFADSAPSVVENRIRSEPTHTYLNEQGESVAWRFLRIAAIEQLDELKDGAEIVGFITDRGEIGA
jgi:hypothetical protein